MTAYNKLYVYTIHMHMMNSPNTQYTNTHS